MRCLVSVVCSGIFSIFVSFNVLNLCILFSDMSVTHSPHFDWVVVHVGSSFPETVITKVLTCGLKDFYNNETATQV